MSSTGTTSPPIVFEWSCGETIGADTMTGLVQQILGDTYQPDNAEAALIERYETLTDLASKMQAIVMVADDVDIAGCDEALLTAALGDKHEPTNITRWDAAFPLIVVASLYDPYSDVPRPEGDVIVIDPHTEKSFLEAFTQLGLAILVTR